MAVGLGHPDQLRNGIGQGGELGSATAQLLGYFLQLLVGGGQLRSPSLHNTLQLGGRP
ncbi:hypothetical protein ACW9KT_18655 [Hymenobacter sp. HD11105]